MGHSYIADTTANLFYNMLLYIIFLNINRKMKWFDPTCFFLQLIVLGVLGALVIVLSRVEEDTERKLEQNWKRKIPQGVA